MLKTELIDTIIALDQETFCGIDDPSYLFAMTETQLEKELANLEKEIDND